MASTQYAVVISGPDLRSRRERLGLTLRDVAQLIGSPNSYSALRKLEVPATQGGRHTLSVDRAIRVGLALQVPPSELHKWFEFHGVDASAA